MRIVQSFIEHHRGRQLVLLLGVLTVFLASPRGSWADGLFVSGVSPNFGPTSGGTVVTITGNEFIGAIAVYFGATSASSFTVINNTTIVATSPAGGPGTVDITVTVDDPTTGIVPADHFTYVAATTSTPTLSQWSMIALAFLLAGAGYLALIKFGGRRTVS